MTQSRERKWENMSREEKLANILYPNLAPEPIKKEMAELAAKEGKPSPMHARLDRVDGRAKRT